MERQTERQGKDEATFRKMTKQLSISEFLVSEAVSTKGKQRETSVQREDSVLEGQDMTFGSRRSALQDVPVVKRMGYLADITSADSRPLKSALKKTNRASSSAIYGYQSDEAEAYKIPHASEEESDGFPQEGISMGKDPAEAFQQSKRRLDERHSEDSLSTVECLKIGRAHV